jgi:hypothetical protein
MQSAKGVSTMTVHELVTAAQSLPFHGCLTDDIDTVPEKVIHPPMMPRVEQLDYLVCFRIDTR